MTLINTAGVLIVHRNFGRLTKLEIIVPGVTVAFNLMRAYFDAPILFVATNR